MPAAALFRPSFLWRLLWPLPAVPSWPSRPRRRPTFLRGSSSKACRTTDEAGASAPVRPSTLITDGLALPPPRGPVAEQQAGDQAQQQHRQQPEQGAVAAHPAAQPALGLGGVADGRHLERAGGRPLGRGVGALILEHVEEPQPHGRDRVTAGQAVALVGNDLGAAVGAGGPVLRVGGHRHQAHVRHVRRLAEGALDVFAGAGGTGRSRRLPRSPRTRPGRRGT